MKNLDKPKNEREKWNNLNIRNQCWVILDELDAAHNKKDDERVDIIEENVNFLIKEAQQRLVGDIYNKLVKLSDETTGVGSIGMVDVAKLLLVEIQEEIGEK